MQNIKVYTSNASSTEKAFEDLSRNIPVGKGLIIYFTSTKYDFEKLDGLFNQKYSGREIVGLTTVGEINNKGIEENTVTAVCFDENAFKAKAVFIENIEKYPIFQKAELEAATRAVGINTKSSTPEKEGFSFVFPNGLINAEERMLNVVNSIFDKAGFNIFGGTAGDDAKFVRTYTAVNGRISDKSGVAIFIKTNYDFKIYKESSFEVFSREELIVTKGDTEKRIVYEFNGKRATAEYSRILGIKESELNNLVMKHPLGFVRRGLSVGTPLSANPDGSITFYCQVPKGSEMNILTQLDNIKHLENRVEEINNDFKTLEGAFVINCILRKIHFKNTNILGKINSNLSRLNNAFGFCSYGEQLENEQLNQTMVVMGIGKLKNKGAF